MCRLLNSFTAIVLLVVLSPILLTVVVIIFIEDGFPIFFKQVRLGNKNTRFLIYKFRTMKKDMPDIPTHLVQTEKSIYTTIGPFLRKLSIDELPQLINIVKGDMTFIGPRPALHNQDDLIQLRTEARVHTLMPGVTGWAQVNGRDELTISKKVEMDTYYLKNQSILLDIKIMFMTVLKVFKTESVSH